MGNNMSGLALDPLNEDIKTNLDILKQNNEEREQTIDRIVLNAKAGEVKDLSAEITEMMKNLKSWKRQVVDLIAGEIVRMADGDLACFSYEPRSKAEQQVHLYQGTHWVHLEQPVFFGFVDTCCAHIGVEELELHDPSFMSLIYEWVAFRVKCCLPVRHSKKVAYINLANGTLEVHKEGDIKFREHCREDYFFYVLHFAYDPQAVSHLWHKFLDEVLPDESTQTLLGQYIGYCFIMGLQLEKMLVFYGGGSNGKSVILSIIEALLGSENVSNVSLSALTQKDEKRAMLENKLANISHESDFELDASVLKQLVSNEPVDVRELYHSSRIIRDYARLITSFNRLPRAEMTHGFFRRWLLIPFLRTIEDAEQDPRLTEKLKGELAGIFIWVLDNLKKLMQKGHFVESAPCRQALERYKLRSDSVRLFVCEMCDEDNTFVTTGKDLFAKYKGYCFEDQMHPVGKQLFFERLEALGYKRQDYRRQPMFNLKLRTNEPF